MMFTGCCPTLASLGMMQTGKKGDEAEVGAAEMKKEEVSGGLRRVFDTFDANQDGYLSLEEVCAWTEKLGRPMTKAAVSKAMEGYDWDQDGRLDFNEFLALTHQTVQAQHDDSSGTSSKDGQATYDGKEGEDDLKSELEEAFQIFDKDGNGLISPTELKLTLCELGLIPSEGHLSRIHSMIKRIDTDGDGQVSFSEFKTMMNGK